MCLLKLEPTNYYQEIFVKISVNENYLDLNAKDMHKVI